MFTFRRHVRFDEIDAAGFVYFPKVVALAHEALERLLAAEHPGGYAKWVVGNRIGLPCVHVSADFKAPLRFGDELVVHTKVRKIGDSSVIFDVEVARADDAHPAGQHCATLEYVVACAALDGPKKHTLPDDLRAALAKHT